MKTDDFLSHYGVKGMKWGKRRSSSNGETKTSPEKKGKFKKVAAVVGTTAAVAVMTVGAVYVSKNLDVKLPKKVDTKLAKDFVKSTIKEEPTISVPKPRSQSTKSSAPKAPSPYPMTPLIPTPILDEINKKYGW